MMVSSSNKIPATHKPLMEPRLGKKKNSVDDPLQQAANPHGQQLNVGL